MNQWINTFLVFGEHACSWSVVSGIVPKHDKTNREKKQNKKKTNRDKYCSASMEPCPALSGDSYEIVPENRTKQTNINEQKNKDKCATSPPWAMLLSVCIQMLALCSTSVATPHAYIYIYMYIHEYVCVRVVAY